MMEIKERLALSARPGKLTLIGKGMYLKGYPQQMRHFLHRQSIMTPDAAGVRGY